ncbi:MAG: glycoside hydrolase family 127 protein [Verrucomicrobia bacterium]|nr:glycoside hydrolase family 127 protein [Verrucomicrobiota bacterium]
MNLCPFCRPNLALTGVVLVALLAPTIPALAAAPTRQPYLVADRVADRLALLEPGAAELSGFLGERVRLNTEARLAQVDLEPLLAGFRQKPGSHPWIGEHIGKWMHAATLAWAQSGHPELERKLHYAAAELVKAQEADGYLGTYVPEQRFGLYPGADWDVWSHKYCLIGLLTYYEYTGQPAALESCRRAADLLLATFGPGKKSLLAAGTHVGMAATSVLEPIVILYRFTGDPRYLEFARYVVQCWDETNGPAILKTLLREKNVQKTANAKAYEMLSNLVGLCELYRVAGDPAYLEATLNAWQDIVANRLYLTGSASQSEHFRGDHELPNGEGANVAETCVTTTWIQLNLQLLRLTGEARFGQELERTFYNHLAAAQHTAGADWCYFTPLEGRKNYTKGINCCHSSGPRGMALVPSAAVFTFGTGAEAGLAVNLAELSSIETTVGGQRVGFKVETRFPAQGAWTFTFSPTQPARFALWIRIPEWANPGAVQVEDAQGRVQSRVAFPPAGDAAERPSQDAAAGSLTDGWCSLPTRQWQPGDRVRMGTGLSPRLIAGEHGNAGKAARAWGPFILAYDTTDNPDQEAPRVLAFADMTASPPLQLDPGQPGRVRFIAAVRSPRRQEGWRAVLRPFADAGADGGQFRVWLRAPDAPLLPPNLSLLATGIEMRSRRGNVEGSIVDGEVETFVVTFDGRKADQDWYAVALPGPGRMGRFVFVHGRTFHDGGWFDTTGGKPRLEVQRTADGPWERVAQFDDYPATTATDPAGLRAGQAFTVRLTTPVEAVAVRVVGRPAWGDNPNQAFSSCAELEAFPE